MEVGDRVYYMGEVIDPRCPNMGTVLEANSRSALIKWDDTEEVTTLERRNLGDAENLQESVRLKAGAAAHKMLNTQPSQPFPIKEGEEFGIVGRPAVLTLEKIIWSPMYQNWTIKTHLGWKWVTSPLGNFMASDTKAGHMMAM